MKNKGFCIILFFAVVSSGLFFGLKLRGYLQRGEEFAGSRRTFSKEQLQGEFREQEKVNTKNEACYVNLFKGKTLFKILGKERASLESTEEPSQDISRELAKFELMGIVSSGGTAKALIKDTTNGKTFYGAAGEKLDGFVIKEITGDKIILEHGGKTFELKM